jgi:hypothetical protein
MPRMRSHNYNNNYGRRLRVPLLEHLNSNNGEEAAVNYLIDDTGYSLETGLYIARGLIPANKLMEIAIKKQIVSTEEISQIQPAIKTLKGEELTQWLSKSMNLKNLRYVYRQIYGSEPWNEAWQIKSKLSPDYQRVLDRIGFPIKTNYGEQELENLFQEYLPLLQKALGGNISEEDCRLTFFYMFEDFYDEEKTIERFTRELKSDENTEPFLVLLTVDHPDIGEMIIGFSWGVVAQPPHAIEAVVDRIIKANYSQNPELIALGEEERQKITSAVITFLESRDVLQSGSTLAYCDEIAIIPSSRNGRAFKSVFLNLISQMAIISKDRLIESGSKQATFLFRTLYGAEMNLISDRYLSGYMNQIYLSGSDEDESGRMIFLAGTSDEGFLDMQLVGLQAMVEESNLGNNGKFQEMLGSMLSGEVPSQVMEP